MHPSLSNTILNAHVRDLKRAMWPQRSRRSRRTRITRRRRAR